MGGMFACAFGFNQDISSWDVSSVTDMSLMFINAVAFNQDISSWDVSNVADMSLMFRNAIKFNQDLCIWGEKLNNPNLNYIFSQSGCLITSEPKLGNDPPGPFCNLCISDTTISPKSDNTLIPSSGRTSDSTLSPTISPKSDNTLIPYTGTPSFPYSIPLPSSIITNIPTIATSNNPIITVQNNNHSSGFHGHLILWLLAYLLLFVWFKSFARE